MAGWALPRIGFKRCVNLIMAEFNTLNNKVLTRIKWRRDPGSNYKSACGEGKYVICICIVKSWLISCYGREAGKLFYGFVIGNTNDSQAATVKR